MNDNKIIIMITGSSDPLELANNLIIVAQTLRALTEDDLKKDRVWNYGKLTISISPKIDMFG